MAKNLFSSVISFNEVIRNTDHIHFINFVLVHMKHLEVIQSVVSCTLSQIRLDLFNAENDLLLDALVAGITRRIFATLIISDIAIFLERTRPCKKFYQIVNCEFL